MIDAPPRRAGEVPTAFYRDAGPPLPPDDPHGHEWWRHDGEDRLDERLHADYFGMHRFQDPDGEVEF